MISWNFLDISQVEWESERVRVEVSLQAPAGVLIVTTLEIILDVLLQI